MKKKRIKKRLHVEEDDVDELVSSLVHAVETEDETEVETWISLLAQEPKAILGKSPRKQVVDALAKLDKADDTSRILAADKLRQACRHLPKGAPGQRRYGEREKWQPTNSEYFRRLGMEFASADLIVRLHATATLMFASELEEALRAFIRKRDVARTHNLKEGSHKNRKDPLAMLIEKTFRALLKERNGSFPKAREVLDRLPDFDESKVFQETEDDIIYWKAHGKEKKTTLKTFRNRLTPIRKKFSPEIPGLRLSGTPT